MSALETPWGQLFKNYGNGDVVLPGMEPKTVKQAAVGTAAIALLLGAALWWTGKRKTKK